jgi:single stranded DNA-binding protein
MARSSADITLKGNNVIDVELKYASSGTAMLKLRLAVERWRRQNEQWEKTNTSFVNVQLWGDLAEQTAGIVEKGMRCEVKGYLEERSWEDSTTGEKRYATQVVAQDVLIPVEDIESMVRVQRNKDGNNQSRPSVKMNNADTPAPANDPFDEEIDF